jgi:molybdopterin-biosynthesis enzyme MoeA-like protein
VLITGGLGPTKDDVTKKTFCDYFSRWVGGERQSFKTCNGINWRYF